MPEDPAAVYVTADELLAWRRIDPGELGVDVDAQDAEQQLKDVLTGWSEHVKEIIDEAYSPPRDFLAEADGALEEVPKSVRSVALRALSNYVTQAINARESALINVSEFRVQVHMTDQILSRGLRRELPRRSGRQAVRGFVSRAGDG